MSGYMAVLVGMGLIHVAKWVLLLIFGLFVYRKIKPPTFPWLAAFVLIRIISSFFFVLVRKDPYFVHVKQSINDQLHKLNDPAFGETLHEFVSASQFFATFQGAIDLLVALMIISEVLYLLSNYKITEVPAHFKWIAGFRENAVFWGIVLVSLSLIKPFLSLFVYIKLGSLL